MQCRKRDRPLVYSSVLHGSILSILMTGIYFDAEVIDWHLPLALRHVRSRCAAVYLFSIFISFLYNESELTICCASNYDLIIILLIHGFFFSWEHGKTNPENRVFFGRLGVFWKIAEQF